MENQKRKIVLAKSNMVVIRLENVERPERIWTSKRNEKGAERIRKAGRASYISRKRKGSKNRSDFKSDKPHKKKGKKTSKKSKNEEFSTEQKDWIASNSNSEHKSDDGKLRIASGEKSDAHARNSSNSNRSNHLRYKSDSRRASRSSACFNSRSRKSIVRSHSKSRSRSRLGSRSKSLSRISFEIKI